MIEPLLPGAAALERARNVRLEGVTRAGRAVARSPSATPVGASQSITMVRTGRGRARARARPSAARRLSTQRC